MLITSWLRPRPSAFRVSVLASLARIEGKIDMSSADVMNDIAEIKSLLANSAASVQAQLDAAKAAWEADDQAAWDQAHSGLQSIVTNLQAQASAVTPNGPTGPTGPAPTDTDLGPSGGTGA